MLKNHLPIIKGRLLSYFAETYSNMNTESDGKLNYEDYYDGFERCFTEIRQIVSVSDLDVFCESWGLNDLCGELAFFNLAKEYLAAPEE